jgi:hypothetical protein
MILGLLPAVAILQNKPQFSSRFPIADYLLFLYFCIIN